jgi:hypothetical protein
MFSVKGLSSTTKKKKKSQAYKSGNFAGQEMCPPPSYDMIVKQVGYGVN